MMSLESSDGRRYPSQSSASDENVLRKKDKSSLFIHEKEGDNNCEELPEEFWTPLVKEKYRSQIYSSALDGHSEQGKGRDQVSVKKNSSSSSSNYNNNNGKGHFTTQTRDSEQQNCHHPVQYSLKEAACCEDPEQGMSNNCNGAKDKLWNSNQSNDTQSCCGGQDSDNAKYRHSEACSITTILPNKPEDRIHKPMTKRQDSSNLDVDLETTTVPLEGKLYLTCTYDEAGRAELQNVGPVQKQQEFVKETPFTSVHDAQQQSSPKQLVGAQSYASSSATSFKQSIPQLQSRNLTGNDLTQQAPSSERNSSAQNAEAVTSNAASCYGNSKPVSWESSSQLCHEYSRYPNSKTTGAISLHDKFLTRGKSTETSIFDIEKNDHPKTKQCRGCVVSRGKKDNLGSFRPVTGYEKLWIFVAALSFMVLILLSVVCVLRLQGRALQDRVQALEARVSALAGAHGCKCGQSGGSSSTGLSVNYAPRVYNTKHRAQTQHRDTIDSTSHAALGSSVSNKNLVVNVLPPVKPHDFPQSHGLNADVEYISEMLMSNEMWEVDEDDIKPSFDQQKDKEEDDETDDLPDDNIHENLEKSESSDDHFFADSLNPFKKALALSRHVRSSDGNTRRQKDPDYACKKLKNKQQREKGCQKQNQIETFEAAFYDWFDYGDHFSTSGKSLEDDTGNLTHLDCINNIDHRWNNVAFQACKSAGITFFNSGTALPFYNSTTNKRKHKLLFQNKENPGLFEVRKSGLYLVHFNITIVDENGTHFLRIHLNDRAVLACQDGGFPCPHTNNPGSNKYRICNINGLLQLNENDVLEIRTVAANTQLRLEDHTKSYFRVVLLDAEKNKKKRANKEKRKRRHKN